MTKMTVYAGLGALAATMALCLQPASAAEPASAVPAGVPSVTQADLAAHPDFSGVWQLSAKQSRTYDPDAGLREKPPLKPEWMAKWLKTRERQHSGMRVWDPLGHCLPPGMPHTLSGSYPMEVLMAPGRVTLLTELFNETRRIWTDGRAHPAPDELEKTFQGHAVARWQGDTLVIDTVGVREESVIDVLFLPHSDQVHFIEHVRLVDKDHLDWTVTMDDPVVYAQPWTVTRHFVRSPPGEAIREFVCEDNNQPDKYIATPEDAYYQHPDPALKTHD